jgi:signal peptidase I
MRGHKSALRIVLEPLAVAVLLAVAARSAFRLFAVPSESMTPTLQPGDVIVATPYRFAEPSVGDVIVFRSPASEELLVKRIVATPGELVEGARGRLLVGGHTRAEPYLAGGGTTADVPVQLVPADSYFVLGDNRAASLDSRRFGAVPREAIVGRARAIVWSTASGAASAAAGTSTPGRPPSRSRLSRIFKCIE